MRVIILVLLLVLSVKSFASGCIKYGEWRYIESITSKVPDSFSEYSNYEIVEKKVNYIIVKFPKANKEFKLYYSGVGYSKDTNLPSLSINDVEFEEGNGCGPVYRCKTGQIEIHLESDRGPNQTAIYEFPKITRFEGDILENWISSDLVKPFYSTELSGSDLKYCDYGFW